MTWLFTFLSMAVVAVVAGLVTGRISGGMDAPASSLPFRGLPPDRACAADLEAIRFSPALRGYRMDEVDQVLDRLAEELERRDAEISRLQGENAAAVPELDPPLDLQPLDHQPLDHPPLDHQPLDHPPLDHQQTETSLVADPGLG